jgi:hypothetical protein
MLGSGWRRVGRVAGAVGLLTAVLVGTGVAPGFVSSASGQTPTNPATTHRPVSRLRPAGPAFTAAPSTLSSAGGDVTLSADITGVSTCAVTSTPTLPGLPTCTTILPWPSVSVPHNSSTKTVTYKFVLSGSYLFGGKGKFKVSAVVTVSPPPPVTYVAFGDSYSSGEGNPGKSPKSWVDQNGKPTAIDDGCDRSAKAYPMLVNQTQKTLPSMDLRFLACSGATTGDLWDSGALAAGLYKASGDGGEGQQLLDTGDLAAARVVTVSIGGNDLNFGDILPNCYIDSCDSSSSDSWIANLSGNINILEPILVSTYEKIQAEAPNAALYVVAYPDLFPPHPTTNQLLNCEQYTSLPIVGPIPTSGISYLAANEVALTSMLAQAAATAGAHFVNPNTGPHSFLGHDVCAGKSSWFNGPQLTPATFSYHPNKVGQSALAAAVKAAISQNNTPGWISTEAPSASSSGPSASLEAESCLSVTYCVAIGSGGLIETLSAGAWTAVQAPLPAGAVGYPNELTSISCWSVGNCIALGQFEVEGEFTYGFIDTLSSGTWTNTPEPVPAYGGALDSEYLSSVSCLSGANCVAVGEYRADSTDGFSRGVIETLSGGAWGLTFQSDVNGSGLVSITCPTVDACFAVGGNTIDTFSGGTWKEVAAPLPVNGTNIVQLNSVSCPSIDVCAAVGSYQQTSSGLYGILETLSGGSWTATNAAMPSGITSPDIYLTSVACPSTGTCVAVGFYQNSAGHFSSLMETWLAGNWTNTAAPGPPILGANATQFDYLESIACPTTGTCIAVGAYSNQNGSYGLIDTLSNGTWTSLTAPEPSNTTIDGDGSELSSVICFPVVSCIAVGQYNTGSTTEGLIDSTGSIG